ncbi:biotin--[acetyl-CoA-carboxylase] ligase [Natronogracilivirgula saccharolytica]|uniref:Biotin--[acetyl-CoA-carboxylase] ligase n=2 Tax=Natronogracilivirga saccharolytica TaxID=2812953 RepID=A0A8J7RP27_9BACT|nr:biotin--[acetyl-CoA-carboxylase] ligase [Natronogracilivirga saccharolytica]
MPARRLSHGLVCLADEQYDGKGQYGRRWSSTEGENLTFTIVLMPGEVQGLQLFSLALMYGLKQTVDTMASCDSRIKWPNDLCISGRKAGGVLTECRYNGKQIDRMLLGLGVNINQTTFPEHLQDTAASVAQFTGGQPLDRALFLAVLLNKLEPLLERTRDGDLDLIRDINRCIDGYGKWVSIEVDGKRGDTPVKVLGVNEYGHLLVLDANDDLKSFTHEQVRFDVTN